MTTEAQSIRKELSSQVNDLQAKLVSQEQLATSRTDQLVREMNQQKDAYKKTLNTYMDELANY